MNSQQAEASIWRIDNLPRPQPGLILLAIWPLVFAVVCVIEIARTNHQTESLSAFPGISQLPRSIVSTATQTSVQTMALPHALPPGDHSSSIQTQTDRTVAALQQLADGPESIIPSDPQHDQQWNFFEATYYKGASALFAARAHNSGNYPVVVAVVDSGLMLDHEDLQVLPGYDFVSEIRVANDGDGRDSDPSDPGDWVTATEIANDPVSSGCVATTSKWHGTAVGGIIGAIGNNQRGITGGAPSVLLLPVRVTGKCGGYISDLVDGVRWAAGLEVAGAPANNSPARIINLSVGFPGTCPVSLQNAIDAAVSSGAAVVVAATNSAAALDSNPQSPASCANVTTVGALLRDGSLAPYSATGSNIAILAPGGSVSDGIITTQNSSTTTPDQQSSYGYHFGTSMAAAHVSATFASLLAIDPALTNINLQQLVQRSATADAIAGCKKDMCGVGRLNAKRAVDMLLNPPASEVPYEEELSVSSASTLSQPATAAASDDATTVRPANSGAGQIHFPGILLLFGLILLTKIKRRRSEAQTSAGYGPYRKSSRQYICAVKFG